MWNALLGRKAMKKHLRAPSAAVAIGTLRVKSPEVYIILGFNLETSTRNRFWQNKRIW